MSHTLMGWAAQNSKAAELTRVEKKVESLGAKEVLMTVKSCGICHSDIHLIDDDWGISKFPLVPGHEIVGEVVEVGADVRTLKKGSFVGVGWQRNSCGTCEDCNYGFENTCSHRDASCVGHWGGYANMHVSSEKFCFELPKEFATPQVAPLFCGGATVYSPLVQILKTNRNARVGIVGLGGLGHLAVKFAAAMGLEVTLFSSSESKRDDAKKLGVHHFVSSNEAALIAKVGRRLDMVLVTANVDLPWSAYLQTLRTDGKLWFVGIPPSALTVHVGEMLDKRISIGASPIASPLLIHEMIEFSSRNNVVADVEVFQMSDVNLAVQKVREGKVRHRAVLVNS